MLGHDGPPTAFWRENLITKEKLDRCPMRTTQLIRETDPDVVDELDRYREIYFPAYEDGHLLVAGGIGDQPARYLDIVGRIRSIEKQITARYLELTTKKDEL